MKNIALIGYGALGVQIEAMITDYGDRDSKFLYFDDNANAKGIENAYMFNMYKDDNFSNCYFIVALGYHHLKLKKDIQHWLIENNRCLYTFIHPTAFVNKQSLVKPGAILYPMCNVDVGVTIGAGSLLNNSVIVSHDSTIGECCFIAPGVTMSGQVTVGDSTFIGTNTSIANGVNVGTHCSIGIGTCVTKDVPSESSAIGNPMRIKQGKLKLT